MDAWAGNDRSETISPLVDGVPARQLPSSNYERITCPPSTLMVCPVMLRAWGEARNTATAAISSAVCQRPSGEMVRIFCWDQV